MGAEVRRPVDAGPGGDRIEQHVHARRRRRCRGGARGASRVLGARASLTMRFGGVVALNERRPSTIHEGEIFALIGPNGAGKTTVFNVSPGCTGRPRARSVRRRSRSTGMKRFKVTKRGVARTFQNIRLFHNMTALENVMVGRRRAPPHRRGRRGRWACRGTAARSAQGRERAHGAAGVRRHRRTGPRRRPRTCPYGDQRRLEIARALATEPEAAAARRARGGHEPGGEESPAGADPQDPRRRAARSC